MVDRIQLILKVYNLNASRFADEIGVQRSAISHILSGRNMPSLDLIQKVLRRYPDINSEWLINGSGSMHKGFQPDLFSLESVKEESLPERQIIEEKQPELTSEIDTNSLSVSDIDESEPVVKVAENVINEAPMDLVQEKSKEIPLSIPSKRTEANGRHIEKIVIFYSDKTFREYFPEAEVR